MFITVPHLILDDEDYKKPSIKKRLKDVIKKRRTGWKTITNALKGGTGEKRVRSSSRFACGICQHYAGCGSIKCDECKLWYHIQCINMSDETLKDLDGSVEYKCSRCDQNFELVLNKFKTAAKIGMKNLIEEVKKVKLSEFKVSEYDLKNKNPSSFSVDKVSRDILANFCQDNMKHTPVCTSGDGNCLFNAISLRLNGNEELSTELRVRTVLEMTENENWYIEQNRYTEMNLTTSTFKESLLECGKGGWCSPWVIHALANVIYQPIVTLYPPVNGLLDRCVRNLNHCFIPRRVTNKEKINIMWTSLKSPRLFKTPGEEDGVYWTPNHFSLLVQNDMEVVCIEEEEEEKEDEILGSLCTSVICLINNSSCRIQCYNRAF